MKIFVIGKSAAAHSFIQLLSKSKNVEKIWCAPGNPAIAEYAQCINISLDDITAMVEFAKENGIDLTVPMAESVIQNGIADIFIQENLKIFAPTQGAAQIATSRAFAKKFIYKNKVPTSQYGVFDREASAVEYLKKVNFPVLVKYDHLAHHDAFICASFTKAKNTIEKVFSQVGKKVVVEEFLEGETIRLTIITDGYNVVPLPYVKEYDRVLDGDGGEISKGVGAYAPAYKISSKAEEKIAQKIVFPVLDALQNAGTPYVGFLSMKLLVTPGGEIILLECLPLPSVPEAVCVFQMVEDDILQLINAAMVGALEDFPSLNIADDFVAAVCLMSGNYPLSYKDNSAVEGIENIDDDNLELYYNDAVINSCYEISTTGGRAFFLTARAGTLNKAVKDVYGNIDMIKFDGMRYRKDIGKVECRMVEAESLL